MGQKLQHNSVKLVGWVQNIFLLQIFYNNCTGHKDITKNSKDVFGR